MLLTNLTNYQECGTDEAGRGCLAGPVTAAAVMLPKQWDENDTNVQIFLSLINDSKQLSEKVREKLRPIIQKIALSYHVTHIFPVEIDKINILQASIKAMQNCVLQLHPQPEYVLVDGNRFKPIINQNQAIIPHQCIIKGDSKYMSIAAASILAKTYRDDYMNQIHQQYPMYHWHKNKGYPTEQHRLAIQQYGSTPHHRLSFRLLPEQLFLEF